MNVDRTTEATMSFFNPQFLSLTENKTEGEKSPKHNRKPKKKKKKNSSWSCLYAADLQRTWNRFQHLHKCSLICPSCSCLNKNLMIPINVNNHKWKLFLIRILQFYIQVKQQNTKRNCIYTALCSCILSIISFSS